MTAADNPHRLMLETLRLVLSELRRLIDADPTNARLHDAASDIVAAIGKLSSCAAAPG